MNALLIEDTKPFMRSPAAKKSNGPHKLNQNASFMSLNNNDDQNFEYINTEPADQMAIS
jgi:hypothetical protein